MDNKIENVALNKGLNTTKTNDEVGGTTKFLTSISMLELHINRLHGECDYLYNSIINTSDKLRAISGIESTINSKGIDDDKEPPVTCAFDKIDSTINKLRDIEFKLQVIIEIQDNNNSTLNKIV